MLLLCWIVFGVYVRILGGFGVLVMKPFGISVLAMLAIAPGAFALPKQESSEGILLVQLAEERKTEADQLFQDATGYFYIGQFREAIDLLKTALEIYRDIEHQEQEAASLGNLGASYIMLGEYEQAAIYLESHIEKTRELEDRRGESTSLGNLGMIYLLQGQYEQAINSFEQHRDISREIEDRQGEANALGNLASVYSEIGDNNKALESLRLSLEIMQELENAQGEGMALGNMGVIHCKIGNCELALELNHQSLDIARQLGNRNDEASALLRSASFYNSLGQVQTAIDLSQEALEICIDIGNQASEATALQYLGSNHSILGNYQQAIYFYERSLNRFRHMAMLRGEASSLGGLGTIYSILGDFESALGLYQQSLDIDRQIGNLEGELASLNDIGNVFFAQEDYTIALQNYQQSLEISQRIGLLQGEATALGNLGNVYANLGNIDRAIFLYQEQLRLARQIGDKNSQSIALLNLGVQNGDLGRYKEERALYMQALAIQGEIGDRSILALILANLGTTYKRQDRPEIAIVFWKEAVRTYETIRDDIRTLPLEQQQSYTDTLTDFYREFAVTLIEQGRLLEAQQILELLKLQEIRDYRNDQRSYRSGEDLDLITYDPEAEIIRQHGTLIAFMGDWLDCEGDTSNNCVRVRNNFDDLQNQFDQRLTEFEISFAARREADRYFLNPSDVETSAYDLVEAQPGTVVLYPVVDKNKLLILGFASGNRAIAKEIPVSQVELGETVLKLRDLLDSPASDLAELQATAQQLHQWLIEPIRDELEANNIEHLVFALDRVLRYIPMSVLHDGEQYLIENYTVSTILNASTTSMERSPVGIDGNTILAAGVSEGHGDFIPLPNVPTELDAIVSRENDSSDDRGVYPGLEFLDGDFNYLALRENLTDRRFLHIATHGQFDPTSKSDSFLLLGNGDPLPIESFEPGQSDIQDLKRYLRQLHLIVLSACETALGSPDPTTEATEIPSISSYFLETGAQAVLASLWRVNDASTSELMQQFYDELASGTASEPVTKAEALRRAQLAMLAQMPESEEAIDDDAPCTGTDVCWETGSQPLNVGVAHPYHWSPFVIIGNGL
jgi:CHAT domain-containing protein/tetratricopeptide (TPR) repeat protein